MITKLMTMIFGGKVKKIASTYVKGKIDDVKHEAEKIFKDYAYLLISLVLIFVGLFKFISIYFAINEGLIFMAGGFIFLLYTLVKFNKDKVDLV